MSHSSPTTSPSDEGFGSLKDYGIGFGLCLALTLVSYFIIHDQWLSGLALMVTMGTLAIVQAFVQLYFFLQVGKDPKKNSNVVVLGFMALIVVIVVVGSIWIMDSLNSRVMTGM